MSWGVATRNAVGLGLAGIVSLVSRAVQQAVAVVDPFFNYVTLLLPGNGTNGAQNNTFVDSSTNAFTVTRNGNTTQGTFSPFSQTGWGAYFDGTGDYLTLPTSQTNLETGTGDFTVEAWVYHKGASSLNPQVIYTSGGSIGVFLLGGGGINYSIFGSYDNPNSGNSFVISTGTVPPNQWVHVAFVRSSGTITFYIDGVASGTSAATSGLNSRAIYSIGAGRYADGNFYYPFNGYISNARMVKGTAIYTAAFTPSTTPLTAISGTQLLTCQSNRFIDNSSNAFAITVAGNTSIQAFSPFNPTAAWSAATNGGSGYFDGSGDYLSGIGAVSDFNFMHQSSALFTFECWVYLSDITSVTFFDNNAQSSSNIGVSIGLDASSNIELFITRGVSAAPVIQVSSTTAVTANTWTHIAITYDQSQASSNAKFYINGVAAGTGNKTANAPSASNASAAARIGAYGAGTGGLVTGYISNLRITNSIVYSSAFTPPTGPLTAIADTELLCNFTNAGIYDATAKNDLETVGNAQISTTQSKFGGSSMYFDGTGDRLITRDSPITRIGTAPFTIEAWIYPTNVSPASNFTIIAKGTSSAAGTWQFDITSASKLRFQYDAAGAITSSASLTANVWTHVVVVREGTGSNQTKLYINGSNDGTGTISSNLNTTAIVKIGQNRDSTTDYPGYIQDLRLTNGIARYTTGFTPPTAAFPLT